jgi:hypothetical protein
MEDKIIYTGAGLILLFLILIIIEHIRLSGMINKYRKLIKGISEKKNVEDLMLSYSEVLNKVKIDLEENIERRIKSLEEKMETSLRNVGIVRYNAFENVGNNMSFSLAAVDDNKDGFILTGIYTRENSYVYIKEIANGQSKKELSLQEKEALLRAFSHTK